MERNEEMRFCMCCGNSLRFPYSCNEICEVCGWEDDELQNDDPQFDGGANDMSLEQAREAYRQGRPVH